MPSPSEISIIVIAPISAPSLGSGGSPPEETADGESHASASLISKQTKEDALPVLPFLKFPAEIRLQIYCHLLNSHRDIRIGKLRGYAKLSKLRRKRLLAKKRADKNWVAYQVDAIDIHPAILSVNRQIYLEASQVLYSENQYSFNEFDYLRRWIPCQAMMSFLQDRSERSRRFIRRIEFNYYEDEEAQFREECAYLSRNMKQLRRVTLRLYLTYERPYESYLSNLDQQSWIQQLVPLVYNLETLQLCPDGPDAHHLICPVQTYLESKMHKPIKHDETPK